MTRERTDLRVRRTHALLQKTLIDLIAEKGFDAVTVGDIAERAMVNRSTFYRHYPDKYALVTNIFEDAVDQLVSELGQEHLESLDWMVNVLGTQAEQPISLEMQHTWLPGKHSLSTSPGMQTLPDNAWQARQFLVYDTDVQLHGLRLISTLTCITVAWNKAKRESLHYAGGSRHYESGELVCRNTGVVAGKRNGIYPLTNGPLEPARHHAGVCLCPRYQPISHTRERISLRTARGCLEGQHGLMGRKVGYSSSDTP